MEQSYGFPSNFASRQMIFTAHIGESYYKGLDIPFPYPNLVVNKSLWSCPNQFGQTKTILDRPICFGHIEGQSISCLQKVGKKGKKIGQTRAVAIGF